MEKIKPHQKLPTNWGAREILREKGQFWTPSWVAEAMISYVAYDTDLIFDPAAGRGAFFKALLKLKLSGISYFGIDIDSKVLSDKIYDNPSCFVEIRDFIKNPPQRKFNSIVANPPYIRHHRIDEQTKVYLKKLAVSITGLNIDGRAGFHIYFLIQALNLLEKNGRLAFIMPSDTCEGTFSKKLWKWISEKYSIEAVINFDQKATPFPNVDINAMVFLISNSKPQENFFWIKSNNAYTDDLLNFISSEFHIKKYNSLDIISRELNEAINTGLSRPEQNHNGFKHHLNDFAKVIRGIATGSNNFFFLTGKQVEEFEIPKQFLRRAIGRTKDVISNIITESELHDLEQKKRPTYLLAIDGNDSIPKVVLDYLKIGEKMGLPNRPLIKQRKPWFKMEKREIPPILFAYLGRRNTRFILNEAKVLPLTGFLCVYPTFSDLEYIHNLWQALNHPDTLENLKLVGKSYGSGAIKVEPRNLSLLPIPEHIVTQYKLDRPYISKDGQLEIFREPKNRYAAKKHS